MNSRADNLYRSSIYSPTSAQGSISLSQLVAHNPQRYPFLLQSVAAGPELARYDVLFAFPGETLTLHSSGELTGPESDGNDFLAALDRWWIRERGEAVEQSSSEWPFRGGFFVYLGYELAAQIEPSLALTMPEGLPVAFATRTPVAVIRDRETQELRVIAETASAANIELVLQDLAGIAASDLPGTEVTIAELSESDADGFVSAVLEAKKRIRAGDIFQANLSRCWHARFAETPDPVALYSLLCRSNPAPFAGLVVQDEFALLSSSPERLIRKRGSRVDTRPIAGTMPRQERSDQAEQQKRALLSHPKERAEHVMLIDLERNDLGRVCVGGSVEVSEFMVIETYSHVHHIVSNVTGIAREGLTPGELFRAVFPGGTITGCPKVRCMEIIHELEQRARGAYTGSMGYLNLNGDCDLNILIRTMTLQGDRVEFAAGGGIVADSDPLRELEETRAKAKGLLLALQSNHSGIR